MHVVSGAQSFRGKYLQYLERKPLTYLLGVSVATIYACAHVRIPMEIQKKKKYIYIFIDERRVK